MLSNKATSATLWHCGNEKLPHDLQACLNNTWCFIPPRENVNSQQSAQTTDKIAKFQCFKCTMEHDIFLDISVLLQFSCKSSAFLSLPGPAAAPLSSQHDATTLLHGRDVLFVPNGAQQTCTGSFGLSVILVSPSSTWPTVSQSSGDLIPHEAFSGEETSPRLLKADSFFNQKSVHLRVVMGALEASLTGLILAGPLGCICTSTCWFGAIFNFPP